MKRNLFAIFLALALVVALAFVAAPTAKAADEPVITYADLVNSENSEDYKDYYDYNNKVIINGDFVLDLQGQDVTVNVADGVTLSVIDSANKGTTGENAGSLTNTGAGSVVAYEGNYQGIRFLKVVTNTETDDNDKIISKTYAFHPCFVGIDMIGVNTNKGALCLKVTYMTNKAAQGYIGETGIMYGADPENLTSAADTFGAFSFEGTVMTAYFDLIGSLDNETAIGESRVFKAYFKSDDQVVANLPIEISPKDVLSDLNNDISVFSLEQREKMVGMIAKNSVLEKYCDNFFSKGYKLVTDAAELTVGDKIVITAAKSNYAMGADRGNNRGAVAVTKDGDSLIINGDVQILTLTQGKASGTFGFYTGTAGYLYAASSSSNYLKTKTTLDTHGSFSITTTSAGVATIKAPSSSNRNWVRFNDSNSPVLFSCYSSGQADVSVYKLTLIPACVEHTGGEATCTGAGLCEVCGKDYIPAITHIDDDNDHYCDYDCGTKMSNCVFDKNHECICGETTECVDTDSNGACDYCGASLSVSIVEKTETMNIYANKGSLSNKVITWTGTNFTFQNAQDKSTSAIRTSDSDHHRVYANSKVIITGTNGAEIKSVVITCSESKYVDIMKTGLESAGCTTTVSGNNITATLASPAASISFSVTAQTRLNKISVTYNIESAN